MGLQDVMYKSGWLERWMVILCYMLIKNYVSLIDTMGTRNLHF